MTDENDPVKETPVVRVRLEALPLRRVATERTISERSRVSNANLNGDWEAEVLPALRGGGGGGTFIDCCKAFSSSPGEYSPAWWMVWVPPWFSSFVIVDDDGNGLNVGTPKAGSSGLPPLHERVKNFRLVENNKYGSFAKEFSRRKKMTTIIAEARKREPHHTNHQQEQDGEKLPAASGLEMIVRLGRQQSSDDLTMPTESTEFDVDMFLTLPVDVIAEKITLELLSTLPENEVAENLIITAEKIARELLAAGEVVAQSLLVEAESEEVSLLFAAENEAEEVLRSAQARTSEIHRVADEEIERKLSEAAARARAIVGRAKETARDMYRKAGIQVTP